MDDMLLVEDDDDDTAKAYDRYQNTDSLFENLEDLQISHKDSIHSRNRKLTEFIDNQRRFKTEINTGLL
jgi:hypothetical protein